MVNEKVILFTGGGTAGHVIVNIALIPHFLNEGWKVHYIGSKNGIEKELVNNLAEVTYHEISTGKLRRYLSIENLKDPFKVLKGVFDAWKIIGKVRPNIVFSKGGFVSVPVVVAAKLRSVPTIIHESDLSPGLANKLSIPFAKKIVTTFEETKKYLPENKTVHIGAIVREELFTGDENVGLELTGLTKEKPILLMMGGSSGSQRLNDLLRSNLKQLLPNYQFIHICGQNNVDERLKQNGYVQFEYVNDELKHLFAISDYVISRAGANAIFEFLALKKPMLLIPLPLSASRGDQIENAKVFHKHGLAEVLFEEDLSEEKFLQAMDTLIKKAPVIIDQLKKYANENSRQQVIKLIEQMAKH